MMHNDDLLILAENKLAPFMEGAEEPGATESLERVLALMRFLRSEEGCPWDRKQDLRSLRKYTIEEGAEVQMAISNWLDTPNEATERAHVLELGDLLLQIVFQAQVARDEGRFNFSDVLDALYLKLVRRHPHLFDETIPELSWEELKQRERKAKQKAGTGGFESALDDIPSTLPEMLRAFRLGERANSLGFDWPNADGCFDKVAEEIEEVQDARRSKDSSEIEAEMGDVLFACIDLCRHLKVDPHQALRRTNRKFESRFRFMESEVAKSERTMSEHRLNELEAFWQRAKEIEE